LSQSLKKTTPEEKTMEIETKFAYEPRYLPTTKEQLAALLSEEMGQESAEGLMEYIFEYLKTKEHIRVGELLIRRVSAE